MNRVVVRSATRVLAAALLSGATLLAMAGPAMAEPAGLPPVKAATKFDQKSKQAILARHNTARTEVGVAPLAWDDGLANSAQAWADKLAADNAGLKHGRAGENLNSADPASDPGNGANGWYAEKALYEKATKKTDYNKDTNPDFLRWGHYTQMVWKNTTKIGCGTATSATKRYNVCHYSPPGNVQGQLPYPGADRPNPGPNPNSGASVASLNAIGVDYSVPKSDLTGWLGNPQYTPYPAISDALLRLVGNRKFDRPVYIDVIVHNYESTPGVKSPRRVEDVNTTVLKKSVVDAWNFRNGENATNFDSLLVSRG